MKIVDEWEYSQDNQDKEYDDIRDIPYKIIKVRTKADHSSSAFESVLLQGC